MLLAMRVCRPVRPLSCDDRVRTCMILGWEAVRDAAGSRCTCGVLGSGGRNPGKREGMMWPQQWGDALVHQRLCDGRGVCVLRVSQVVPAVPVSIRVHMTASELEMPSLHMSAKGRSRLYNIILCA